ncbi:hypothetical protein RRG08_011239 [Elysia crispata]|uniref:Uncharacterized protein n=1 Tax=Elysia crispata TaxID=231223 RepID=A0AAE0YNV0_9GAST|nr:hypothetical protein RRG08_011239 [Elysia crispata]
MLCYRYFAATSQSPRVPGAKTVLFVRGFWVSTQRADRGDVSLSEMTEGVTRVDRKWSSRLCGYFAATSQSPRVPGAKTVLFVRGFWVSTQRADRGDVSLSEMTEGVTRVDRKWSSRLCGWVWIVHMRLRDLFTVHGVYVLIYILTFTQLALRVEHATRAQLSAAGI